jgi:hypothetical protein
VQEATFEVSLAAEAWLEMLAMHYGTVLTEALAPIAAAEASLRAAERAEDDLWRQCTSACSFALLRVAPLLAGLASSNLRLVRPA